ncbi:hypothetical protein M8J77_009597 [Diaphorina citri]|nr:hypothetical protein M8J77_009597 [Diaphorina citri]
MRKRQRTSTSYDECCRRTRERSRHAEVVCPDTYAEAGVLSKSEECHCSFCLRLSDKRPPCCLYAIRSQLGRDNTGSCLCLSDRRHPCCLNAIRFQLGKDDTGNQSPQRPYSNSRYARKCRDDGNSDRTDPFLSGKNIPRSTINKLLEDYSYYLDDLANSVNDSSSSSEDEPGSRDDGRFQPPEMDTKNKTYKPSKEKKKSSRKTNKKRREKEEAISEEKFRDGFQYEDTGDGPYQSPEMDTKNKTYKPSKEKKKSSRKTNKKRREKEEAISEEGFSDGFQYEGTGDGPYQSPEMDSKNKTYKPSKEKKTYSRKTNKKCREKEEAISEEGFRDGSQYEDTGDGPYQSPEMDSKNKTYKPSKEKKTYSRKTNKKCREKEEAISEEGFSDGSQYEDKGDGPYQPPEMDSKNKTYKPSKEKKKSSRKTNKKRREKEEAISEEKFSVGSQYEDTDDGPYQPPEMDTKNKTYKPSKEKKKSSRKTNKKRRGKEEAISEEEFSDGSQYEDTGDGPYQPPEMDTKNKTYKPSKEKKKSSRKTNKKRREKEEAISEEGFSDGSQYEDKGDGPYQPPEMNSKNKTYKPSKEKKKSSRKTNKKRRGKEEAISEEEFSDGSQYEDTGDGPYQPPEMDTKNKTYKPSKEKKKSSRKTNKKCREKEEAISEEGFSDGSQYEDTGDGPYQPPEMDTKNKTYKPSKEKKKSSRKTNKKRREKEEAISEEKFSVGSQYEDTDDGPYQPPEMDTSEEECSDGSPYEDTEDDKITVRQPRHRYKVPGNDDPFKIIKALNQQYGENMDNLTLNIERKPTDGLDKTRLKLIWS